MQLLSEKSAEEGAFWDGLREFCESLKLLPRIVG
jgi:hypothetical protein